MNKSEGRESTSGARGHPDLHNKQIHGLIGSPKILPFLSFGNENIAYLSGMVVEENGVARPVEGQSRFKNLVAMISRYLSNELEYVNLTVSFMGRDQHIVTDRHGIFRCDFPHSSGPSDALWQKYRVGLNYGRHGKGKAEAEGEVMVLRGNPEFGVISDIDDTILVSYATRKLMKLRLMLLNNAYTRMPFAGVSAFYSALQHGKAEGVYNPVFYVSNSEWNLYDLLYEFIAFHRIPKGPLLLREMEINIRQGKMKELKKNHKIEVITRIFSMYPDLKFILIGDSGQKDPEIYSEIVKLYPGRVLAVYIRDTGIKGSEARTKVISERVQREFKTEMLLVSDTEAAARHALEKGFISGDYYQDVIREKQKDKGELS